MDLAGATPIAETRYTPDHLWLLLSGGGATVGVTRFAMQALGPVAHVRLPEPGRRVRAGEACADIETVKAASEVHAPAGGTILQVNTALMDDPTPLGSDPEGAGWLFRIAPDDPAELGRLLDGAAYAALLAAL